MKTEEARGWGIRVGGPWPYLMWELQPTKAQIMPLLSQTYQRPMECVLIPLREWRRLTRKAKKGARK